MSGPPPSRHPELALPWRARTRHQPVEARVGQRPLRRLIQAGAADLPSREALALQEQNLTTPAAKLQRYHRTGKPGTYHHHIPRAFAQVGRDARGAGHGLLHLRMNRSGQPRWTTAPT